MTVHDAVVQRRSIKQFTDEPVSREQIERLLDAATHAPNHRMTEPWRFRVLGPASRRAFGTVLGGRKAKRVDDADAKEALIAKVAQAHADLPAMIVVSTTLDENPEIREEDYAATLMGVQNLCLVAHEMGLGTHLKSGAVMDDPLARAAFGVPEGERVVIMIELGVPAAEPEPKARMRAAELTTWVD